MSTFANPYTDFAFKRLFGTEANKDILIDFLNCLVLPQHQIRDIRFSGTEALPTSSFERKAFFDIRCEAVNGSHFIVEMQKAIFPNMKDRALFYSTFPIKEQAEKGDWDFRLDPVYFIALLDFECDEREEKQKFFRMAQIKDQDGDLFSDKLHFCFLQMPLFNKTESQLNSHFDKWCYFLKHAPTLQSLPAILNEPIFAKGAETLKVSHFNKDELDAYEESLKGQRDLWALIHTRESEAKAEGLAEGKAEGLAEGKAEGKYETALELKKLGLDEETIFSATGLRLSDLK